MLRSRAIHIILLILLAAGVYANSLGGDFVYDDKAMIVAYDLVKDIKNIPAAFVSATSIYGNVNYYRPVQTVSYIMDYFLWGKFPAGFHLTNILFHIIAVLLIYGFISSVFKDRILAFLTAIMFSAHPVHTTVVSYIAGRADAMLCVFMLGCLLFYIKARYKDGSSVCYIFSLLLFIAALATKESAMIIPIVILLFDKYGYRYTALDHRPQTQEKIQENSRRSKPNINILFFVILAGYLVFRVMKMSFFVEGAVPAPPFINRLITVPYVLAQYLRLIVLPNDLHIGRGIWLARSFLDGRIIISSIVIAAACIGVYRSRNREKTVFFGAMWFIIMIAPSLNIITPLFYTIAENWLYIPSIGLFLAIAALIKKVYERFNLSGNFMFKYILAAAFILYVCAMAFVTLRHNLIWKDEITLGSNTLKYNPREFKVYNNIGVVYLGQGELDRAEEAFRKCLDIKPDTGMAYFNLYRVYLVRGERSEAVKYLKKAKELDPQRVGILIEKMGIRD